MAKKKFCEAGSLGIISQLKNNTIKTKKRAFKFTSKQTQCLDLLLDPQNPITFISGCAGTGKTFLAVYAAIELMKQDPDKQLIYVRSLAESADKGIGYLPGDQLSKIAPFMGPLEDKLEEIVEGQDIVALKKEGRITGMPVNFVRGSSWANKIVILDESQSFSVKELVSLMTRLGEGSKLFICGDPMQSDIGSKTGFKKIMNLFDCLDSKDLGINSFYFGVDDIVRSKILKFIMNQLSTIGVGT